MFVSAVVPAAGLGLRLNSKVPKPLVELNKKPIFIRTLEVLSRHPDVREIVLVVSSNSIDSTERYLKKNRIEKIKKLVAGGAKRTDSVRNGLKQVSPEADLVLIHDAVRPFIDSDMISRVILEAAKCGAAVVGVPLKSAIKEIDKNSRIIRTLNRRHLCEIQTPQVFRRELIIEAYGKFPDAAAVDDAALVEKLGKKVAVVSGSYFNIKITTPDDLVFARSILLEKYEREHL
ncbi:MAG: 2-C-methyl-D-erythritol 4-phosphate cytidylyltransferase [Candidatus Omnitrophota bacterium]